MHTFTGLRRVLGAALASLGLFAATFDTAAVPAIDASLKRLQPGAVTKLYSTRDPKPLALRDVVERAVNMAPPHLIDSL